MFALFFIVLWIVVFCIHGQYGPADNWFWRANIMAFWVTLLVWLGIYNFG